jgi:hypothetical protein
MGRLQSDRRDVFKEGDLCHSLAVRSVCAALVPWRNFRLTVRLQLHQTNKEVPSV